jgi:hypothetical protein
LRSVPAAIPDALREAEAEAEADEPEPEPEPDHATDMTRKAVRDYEAAWRSVRSFLPAPVPAAGEHAGEKFCSGCRRWKPVDCYATRRASRADGLQTWCKACLSEATKESRRRRREDGEEGGGM